MRCTLHLFSARDYVSLRPAVAPALVRGMQSALRDRARKLDVHRLIALARGFFEEEPRTFDELRGFLATHHPKGDVRTMAYAIRNVLPLVQVPPDVAWGSPGVSDFAVAASWPGQPVPAGQASPEALVLRYLAAFGPATSADMQVWSGLPALRDTFDALRPKLVVLRDDRGRELFDLPKAPRPGQDAAAPVRFLPEFDNVLLSHADPTRILAEKHRPWIFLPNLIRRATFLVDGMVAGTWKVERAPSPRRSSSSSHSSRSRRRRGTRWRRKPPRLSDSSRRTRVPSTFILRRDADTTE